MPMVRAEINRILPAPNGNVLLGGRLAIFTLTSVTVLDRASPME